jgi:nucleotide-binding universal stress UspA family protein
VEACVNPSINAAESQRLLLATDLSAHCDRPLERARLLATQWRAELAILTVHEGPDAPAEVIGWLDGDHVRHETEAAAQRALLPEFDGSGVHPSLHLASGPVADAIPAAAERLRSTLVITGSARCETLGHLLLGSTVERLARSLSQPLLVVRRRARAPYRRILVPSDFSPAARLALETAVRLFPHGQITLFHARQAGIDALAGQTSAGTGPASEACAHFLDGCRLNADARARIAVVICAGKLDSLLARHVQEHDIELAVLGLHDQPGMLRVLMGSTAERLLHSLACDTLVVRADGNDDPA